MKTVKPQGFVGSNPTASARNAARPEPAGSGRFSLFGPAFRLELPAHERMFHVKHSRGGRFARMEPASAVHDWAAHAQQNRRFGTPDPPGCHIPRRPPNTTWGFASAFFGKRGRSSSRCAKPTILLHIDKRNRAEADARCRRSAPKPPDHCHGRPFASTQAEPPTTRQGTASTSYPPTFPSS